MIPCSNIYLAASINLNEFYHLSIPAERGLPRDTRNTPTYPTIANLYNMLLPYDADVGISLTGPSGPLHLQPAGAAC